jgi:xylulokinase
LLNVRERKWHTDLMGKLGIDAGLMPRVVESQEVTGKLTAAAGRARSSGGNCRRTCTTHRW